MHSFVKQTPVTAACISDLLPEIVTTIGANSTPTFSIFLSTEDDVGFDPANNRVNVTFSQVGIIRGSTSVAFRSAPDEPVSENTLPTGAVVITGSAEENQTLGVNTSDLLDGDGLGSFLFQWQRNETNITNANEATYSLGDEDVDTNIRVVVSYTDDGGSFESVTSAAVLIANINDAPVIQDPSENLVAYVSEEFDFTPLFDDIDSTTSEGEELSLTVTQLPAWLSFFPLDQGRITGTPQITDVGQAPVSITVQDDGGLSDTLSFTITIVEPKTVTLSWTAPTQRVNGDALSAEEFSLYKISYELSGQTPTVTTIPATSTSYIIPVALTPGTYYFKVKAIDADSSESDYTDEISAVID